MRQIVFLVIVVFTSINVLCEQAFAAGRDYSFMTLRCHVPSTSGFSRAIRRAIELRLAQDQSYLRARVQVRFRRQSRGGVTPVHVDELLSGLEVTSLEQFRYQITGSPVLHRCLVDYEVHIQVTVARFIDSYGPFYDGFDDYNDYYSCGYYGDCLNRVETITRSSSSHIQLEGVLVG